MLTPFSVAPGRSASRIRPSGPSWMSIGGVRKTLGGAPVSPAGGCCGPIGSFATVPATATGIERYSKLIGNPPAIGRRSDRRVDRDVTWLGTFRLGQADRQQA